MNHFDNLHPVASSARATTVLVCAAFLLAACAAPPATTNPVAASSSTESKASLSDLPAPLGPSSASPSHDELVALVASPDRRPEDRTNDVRRKPVEMLYFIGVNRGMTILDLSAGGGYTTELLARAAGPTGKVVGQSAPRADGPPPSFALLTERAKNLRTGKIIPVLRKFEDPAPPEMAAGGFELATMMFNYHDLGHLGVDREKMNKAVFAALKPGSMYIIADHSGRPGTGISESGTLHRVEQDFVRKEVQAAGFKFVDEAQFLRNPADPRDKNTPDNGQAKDEFVLKFVR